MGSWNVAHIKKGEYELLNDTATLISFSPKAAPDISWLLSRMEEIGVPISYTRDLKNIYFTYLKGGDHGDYCNHRIRISCDKRTREIMDKVFIHEIAHHVDDMEDITSDDMLMREKKLKGKHMADSYARKNVGEYFAVGFEVYYFGTVKEKKTMRTKNPYLYKKIQSLHRKFSHR